MALKLAEKQAIVEAVAEVAARSSSVIAAEYKGISVEDMTVLRSKARQAGVHLQVTRNTLAKRALKNTPFECMSETLVGPILLAFGGEELGAGARLLQEFAKTNDKLVVKSLSLGGTVLAGNQLAAVANLPTRLEAIAKLLAVMQAPIAKMVQTLAAPTSKLVRILVAVRNQKQ